MSSSMLSERKEQLHKDIEFKVGRVYYIEESEEIISAVSTSAETSTSAMIVNVCTLLKYRGKGYASAILSKILDDLLKEKENVCLFYDNLEAGRIYQKKGFKEIGIWKIYTRLD